MAYDVPGSGRHHRRPGGTGKHQKYRKPALSASDKIWLAGLGTYVVLMLTMGRIADIGPTIQFVLTAGLVGSVAWRIWHHPGDRRFNGVNTTPEEDAEFARITGELPVIQPTSVGVTPPPPAPEPTLSVAVHKPGRPSWMPTVTSWVVLAGAVIAKALTEAEMERAAQSHHQMNRLDQVLGVPGAWNNYQPTVPAHGTPGWAPAPDAHHFSGGVKVSWQEPMWPGR